MTTLIKLVCRPSSFFWDHWERGCPTPKAVKETKNHVWIAADDPALAELLSDAEHYAHPYGPDNCSRGLIASAKTVVKAIKEHTSD